MLNVQEVAEEAKPKSKVVKKKEEVSNRVPFDSLEKHFSYMYFVDPSIVYYVCHEIGG